MSEMALPLAGNYSNGRSPSISSLYLRPDRIFVLFLVGTILWPHKLGWEIGWLWNPSRILLAVLLVAWVAAWRRGQVSLNRTPLDTAFLFLTAIMLASFLANSLDMGVEEYNRALKTLGYATVEWFLLYYVVTSIPRNISQVRKFLVVIVGVIAVMSLVGVLEYLSGFRFFEWLRLQLPGGSSMVSNLHEEARNIDLTSFERGGIARIVSSTISWQEVATLTAMGMPLAFYFVAYARSWRNRVIGAFTLMIIASALFLSVTRGALAAAAVALVTVALFSKNRLLRGGIIIFAVASLLVVAVFPQVVDAFMSVSTPEALSSDDSFQGRLDRYPLAAELLKDHEFWGVGVGQVTGHQTTTLTVTDNWYLAYLVETGYLGIAAIGLTWAAILALLFRRKKIPGNRGSEIRDLRIAILAAAVVFMIMCFSFDAMVFITVSKTFFVLVALGTALYRLENKEAQGLSARSTA